MRRSGERKRVLRRAVRIVLVLLVALVVEYVVIPELVVASHGLSTLRRLNLGWVIVAVAAEAMSLLAYALLLRTLLRDSAPSVGRMLRIVVTTTGLGHLVPSGGAAGVGLGFRLLVDSGVNGTTAGVTLAAASIGSAVVLNVMLWGALIVSIPFAGLHPLYVVVALVGLVGMSAVSVLVYLFTRGEERAMRMVRAVGTRMPGTSADQLERLVHRIESAVANVATDPSVRRRAIGFAAANWLLDAGALWSFLAALGHAANPIEVFAAYGIANVLGALPITPGGLGIIEASAASVLATFGLGRGIATLGVLGWRLLNFWLPIPLGAVAYLSLLRSRDPGRRPRQNADQAGGAAPGTTVPANPEPTSGRD